MRMHTMLRNAMVALFILMVAGGQVVGMRRGYVCDHGTVVRETPDEHCHDDGPSDGDQAEACGSVIAESCDSKGGKQRHVPLHEGFQATSPGSIGVSIPSFVSILLLEMPDFSAIIRSALTETNVHHASLAHTETHCGTASGVQVALNIVMLI